MLLLRGTWMRGGTSKCWLFDAGAFEAAEAAGAALDEVLLAAFGAADPRQIDGVGGATSTTSKAAVVRRSAEPGVDVEYTFAQVGIGTEQVEWGSNCGNCASAIGLHALQEGTVPVHGARTTVRMRNLNTGALLAATVPTPHGSVPESGSATVPGVHVGGVPVELSFEEPAGTTTGRLLPTGRPVDQLVAPGPGAGTRSPAALSAPATLIDAGAPAVLLDAGALGWNATDTLAQVAARIGELTRFRRAAALAMGLAAEDDPVSHAVPKTGLVGPAADYRTSDGRSVSREEYDIAVRMVSMHAPHPSIGLTSAVAVAAAAGVPGSVVARALAGGGAGPAGPAPGPVRTLRLGTPGGVVTVRTEHDADGGLRAVCLARAARRLAVAELFVPLAAAPGPAAKPARKGSPGPAPASTAVP